MELAKIIGLMDAESEVVERLETLINDRSVEVARYAIQSAARLKREEHLPAIIDKLSNTLIHEDAVSALKSYGDQALSILQKYLRESSKTRETRRDVAKVLTQIGTQDALNILLDFLEKETEELDADIVDALDRIHVEKADINFPPKFVREKTLSLIRKYCQAYLELANFETDVQKEEQGRQLLKRQTESFEQIFKFLGLTYPREDIVKAYQNLQTGTKDSVAYAIELLDNTLNREMKDVILPLIEDLTPYERLRELQKILKNLK
jgi:AAA family ATP:ADP antiporter